MPVQAYNINTRDAVEGQLYGLQQTRADIQTGFAEDADGVGFGKAVQYGAGERGYKKGSAVAHIAGITIRQIDREAAKRPSDGTVVFRKGDTLPVCSDGRVVVKVADAGQAVHGAKVFVHKVDGTFAIATSADHIEASNVVWGVKKTVAAGDLLHVVITNADVA